MDQPWRSLFLPSPEALLAERMAGEAQRPSSHVVGVMTALAFGAGYAAQFVSQRTPLVAGLTVLGALIFLLHPLASAALRSDGQRSRAPIVAWMSQAFLGLVVMYFAKLSLDQTLGPVQSSGFRCGTFGVVVLTFLMVGVPIGLAIGVFGRARRGAERVLRVVARLGLALTVCALAAVTVAGRVAPPIGWVLGAAAGALLAAAVLRAQRRRRATTARREGWITAHVDADGTLRGVGVDGPFAVPYAGAPAGPCVIIPPRGERQGAPYRASSPVEGAWVIRGTPDEIAHVLCAEEMYDACALSALTTLASPLWAAAAHGRVFG